MPAHLTFLLFIGFVLPIHLPIDPTYTCRFDHLIPSTHHMTNTSDHLIYLLTHHIPVYTIIQLSIGPTYNNTSDHLSQLTAYHISDHRTISLPIGPSYINSPNIPSICPLTLYPFHRPTVYHFSIIYLSLRPSH